MAHPARTTLAHLSALGGPLVITTSRFRRAADSVRVTLSAASSVANSTIPSANITTTGTSLPNSLMANQHGQRPLTAPSVAPTEKKYASHLTSMDQAGPALIQTAPRHTFVPSVVQNPTMPLPGSAGFAPHGHLTPVDSFFPPSFPHFLHYRNFSDTIVHRDSFITADTDSDNIFLRVVHPYDINAFEFFLSKHHLNYFYSLLVPNLRNGFPLGEMPPLTNTVIFKNHPSTLIYSDTVDKYLTDELTAGRMSGPFSLQHAEDILRGPIFCSPLLVSVQIQQPGTPDKLRVCRHLSKGDKNTPSMNSHIQKEDFPTRFDTASRVADIVGSSPHPVTLPFDLWASPRWPYSLRVHIW